MPTDHSEKPGKSPFQHLPDWPHQHHSNAEACKRYLQEMHTFMIIVKDSLIEDELLLECRHIFFNFNYSTSRRE